jgi:hypothetical protein
MHRGAMAEADAIFKRDGLARIDMEAAQILNVDFRADHDLVGVRPEHGAVPHRRRPAQRYPPDDDSTRRDPRLRMNNRASVAQRPDQFLSFQVA